MNLINNGAGVGEVSLPYVSNVLYVVGHISSGHHEKSIFLGLFSHVFFLFS